MVVKMIPKCYSLLKVIIKRLINTVLAFFSYWMPSATPVLFYLSERHPSRCHCCRTLCSQSPNCHNQAWQTTRPLLASWIHLSFNVASVFDAAKDIA